MVFASVFVVSGWTVEQSTKSFPLTLPFIIVATVSLTAASSPRHVKMISDFEIASSMLLATVDPPAGSSAFKSSARFTVRLKMISGLSRFPFSTRFLHMPCYRELHGKRRGQTEGFTRPMFPRPIHPSCGAICGFRQGI